MSKGRGKHSRAFNAKVAQLAGRYQVHPSEIQAWKKVLTEGAAGVCGNGQDQKARSDAALVTRYQPAIRRFTPSTLNCYGHHAGTGACPNSHSPAGGDPERRAPPYPRRAGGHRGSEPPDGQ